MMEYFDLMKMKAMGQRIQEARKKCSLTQNNLAEELGISVDQMSKIENGKSACKPDYIYQLVQMLNVSSDYLFFGKEMNQSKEAVNLQIELPIQEKIMLLLSGADDEDKDRIYRMISIMLEKKNT